LVFGEKVQTWVNKTAGMHQKNLDLEGLTQTKKEGKPKHGKRAGDDQESNPEGAADA